MVRPFKPGGKRRVRSFSYGEEFDDFLYAVHLKAATESMTLSEIILRALEEYAKNHWKDLNAPELKKKLEEITQTIPMKIQTRVKKLQAEANRLINKTDLKADFRSDCLFEIAQKLADFQDKFPALNIRQDVERIQGLAEKLRSEG